MAEGKAASTIDQDFRVLGESGLSIEKSVHIKPAARPPKCPKYTSKVYVRYVDHVLFKRVDSKSVVPVVREAVDRSIDIARSTDNSMF